MKSRIHQGWVGEGGCALHLLLMHASPGLQHFELQHTTLFEQHLVQVVLLGQQNWPLGQANACAVPSPKAATVAPTRPLKISLSARRRGTGLARTREISSNSLSISSPS